MFSRSLYKILLSECLFFNQIIYYSGVYNKKSLGPVSQLQRGVCYLTACNFCNSTHFELKFQEYILKTCIYTTSRTKKYQFFLRIEVESSLKWFSLNRNFKIRAFKLMFLILRNQSYSSK